MTGTHTQRNTAEMGCHGRLARPCSTSPLTRAGKPPVAPRSWRVIAAVLLGSLAGALLAADPPAPPRRATAQDLLFFTADGPVRVRLSVTLDGKPAEDVWRAALDGLFAFCDRNGDGSLESSERAAFTDSGRRDRRFVVVNGVAYSQRPPVISFAEEGGKVGRDAFRDAFRAAGLGPVTVEPVAPPADSKALTDALFMHLDADGDGKLSLAELKAARTRLAALDVDEDEMVTSDELLGRNRNMGYGQVVFSYGSRRAPAPPRLTDVLIPPAGQAVAARDVLAARDTDKDGALSAAEFGGDPKAFAELDADGDGRLDADELAAWLRRPPDLEVRLDLGNAPSSRNTWSLFGEGAGVPPAAAGRLAPRARVEWAGGLKLDLPDARFRFGRDEQSGAFARQSWLTATASA